MKCKNNTILYSLFLIVVCLMPIQNINAETTRTESIDIPKKCIISGDIARTMVENNDATNENAVLKYQKYLKTKHNFDERTSRGVIGLARGMAGMVDKVAKAKIGNLGKYSISSITMFMCDAGSKRKSSPDLLNYLVNNALECQTGNTNNLDQCMYIAYNKFGN